MSGVANPLRGEVALLLGGESFVLRPSFQQLVAAEAEVGSLFRLLECAGRGEVTLTEMGALFWHCLVQPEAGLARAAFEARLLAARPGALLAPYRQLLAAIFGG